MIHTIREAFNELLADNYWMDDETRAVAKEKADAMNERIGYPDLLKQPEELNKEYVMVYILTSYCANIDYEIFIIRLIIFLKFQLNISNDDFILNVLYVLKHEAFRNLQLLRQPVNKDKWSTEPAIVNAFYNPNRNDIGIILFIYLFESVNQF